MSTVFVTPSAPRVDRETNERSDSSSPTIVSVQKRGVITIPPALRRKYQLDKPGAQVQIIEMDGQLVLRPMLPIPASQAWFWTEEWQAGEREVDAEIAAGLGVRVSPEEFLQMLKDELDSRSDGEVSP